ncbi:hypothetical protein G7Z17_g3072 [Cylindrodendrum hubeiense]|uniref:Uncharacterized protein n=1 Tax=Cylindrodendrum hubeiense TaxID=595255 RepID=A0A9P5HBK5_9HYPO|nr:hypothetical protein G7Z17_g3072 [Cylindrodendrum hubeiense]
MSMILAPYNDAMRIGQGFNSYTHELCIDGAVMVKSAEWGEQNQTKTIESPAQVVSYSSRVVEKLSDVVEGMNVSYCSSIKKGTVAVSGSSSTIDETTFKAADLNIVVTVKVTNQTTVIKENAEFQNIDGIEPGSTLFNESYGDSYISGFIQGGEFTGIISIKVLDRTQVESTVKAIKSGIDSKEKTAATELTLNTYGSDSSSNLAAVLKNTESHVSVAWMGGGQVKDETTLWDVDSVFAAAAAFPKRVSECPQRTWAILTKYRSNKSFVKWSHNKLFKALEYDQVSSYTAELFDSYMDYKMILKNLQRIVDDQDGFEPRLGVKDALDTSMETLLSVRSALREEQTKIIEAINILSLDPGVLKRQGNWSASRRSDKVASIIKRALGKWADEDAVPVPMANVTPATTPSDTDEFPTNQTAPKSAAPELNFNFATLMPAEVWKDVMPVPKSNYNSVSAAPSLGIQAQLALSGFIQAPTSDDADWATSKIEVTQSYQAMKQELEKQRAEVNKLRAECDAKISEAMAKTQLAEASRDDLNNVLTSKLQAKDDAVRESQNAKVALEQQLTDVKGQLQTRTVEKNESIKERDTMKQNWLSTSSQLDAAKGQLIPGEREKLHIFDVCYGQTWGLDGVKAKCYTAYDQGQSILINNDFFGPDKQPNSAVVRSHPIVNCIVNAKTHDTIAPNQAKVYLDVTLPEWPDAYGPYGRCEAGFLGYGQRH